MGVKDPAASDAAAAPHLSLGNAEALGGMLKMRPGDVSEEALLAFEDELLCSVYADEGVVSQKSLNFV